jgi:hypothetical protein
VLKVTLFTENNMDKESKETGQNWMHYMRSGEFEKAWQISDAVLKQRAGQPCFHLPRHLQYFWDGSSPENKRVLVRCYHGLGDTIQFIRFAPLLKGLAKKVIVWAQPPLLPLLQTVDGIDELLPLHDGAPEVEYDVDVEVMELPHVFRATVETIPAQIPYLHVQPLPVAGEKEKLSVGLVWRAGEWDPRRHLLFSNLLPLFDVQGIQLYILQAAAKEAGWQEGYGIHPGEYSLAEYAGVVKGLDLLITVDSMPAHLAGAMGVPVWTLLHADADWRWMKDRTDTLWYPTMRLFRQKEQGDWNAVIQRVKKELVHLVTQKEMQL